MNECGKRAITGLARCELPKGHRGVHSGCGEQWGKRAPSLRLPAVSDEQQERKDRWAFIKRCFLEARPECFACGAVGHLDLDHMIPTGRGGEWEPENAQLLCRPCHSRKHGEPMFGVPSAPCNRCASTSGCSCYGGTT